MELFDALEPTSPVAVAPLSLGGRVIGLLIADNKFTRAPISPETQEALSAFATTTAIAVEVRKAREQLLTRLAGLPLHRFGEPVQRLEARMLELRRSLESSPREAPPILDFMQRQIESMKSNLEELRQLRETRDVQTKAVPTSRIGALFASAFRAEGFDVEWDDQAAAGQRTGGKRPGSTNARLSSRGTPRTSARPRTAQHSCR